MVVILSEKVLYTPDLFEATRLVEWNGQWAVTCAYYDFAIITILFGNKLYHCLTISLPLVLGINGKVLDFQSTVTFIGYDTDRLCPAIVKYPHITPFQIAVDHIFLLVSKQKQIKILLFILQYLLEHSHSISRSLYFVREEPVIVFDLTFVNEISFRYEILPLLIGPSVSTV